jgi:ketosteroid isomerase-like protein
MNIVDRLRNAYEMWRDTRGGSVHVWLELLADDVVLRSLADGSVGMEFSAPRRGRPEAEQYFVDVNRDWEMLSFEIDQYISEGDRIATLGTCAWRCRATGKAVKTPIAHFWRFKDEKAIEYIEFYDTAKALAATQPD